MKTLTLISFCCFTLLGFSQADYYGYTTEVGTLFRANEFGAPVEAVHSFDSISGYYPTGTLLQQGTRLYGVTTKGGANDAGVLFYYDVAAEEYSSVLNLDSNFTAEWFAPSNNYEGWQYTTIFEANGMGGKLVRYRFDNPQAELLHKFPNSYTYYGSLIFGDHAFIPANTFPGTTVSKVYKYDLIANSLVDSLELDYNLYGRGSMQAHKLNDSVLLLVNAAGSTYGNGAITAVNVNTMTPTLELAFEGDGSYFSMGMIHQESFFLASYDLSNDMFSILDYSAGNLDTLYTIPFSGNGSERGNHLTVIGENLVFRIADNCYRYNLVTEMGSLVAPVNTGTYGFGSYFSTLMRYSELSVNDNSAELLELYPNPTAGLVNIKSEKIREYQIYSAEGRLLKTGTLTTGLNQINITDLNSGTYSLKSELGIQMIIKQ